ncbi:MAG TPA: biotin/lipoyl-containing protein [Verrucomicrobiae bacterium]|nr:biotin/lipoyl-containing protein [Verrucomicrobiae bacterium]
MSEPDQVLGLLDDLMRLLADSPASTIEVEADGFAVTVTRRGGVITTGPVHVERPAVSKDAASTAPKTQRVHAGTVGIFNGPKAWSPGDAVTRGEVLGGIQTLGHTSDVKAPADGEIREVLVTTGAPVEYGQALFVISLR